MASGLYVAFDLDNTLGFFELTNPLAYLWSPEFLSNPEQSAPNIPLKLSKRLLTKLKRARNEFAAAIAAKEELLWLVLRPNLAAILDPLVASWRAGRVKAVVIYSNTGVSYSMELGAALIEDAFNARGLFRAAVDHWSPLRTADKIAPPVWKGPEDYVEPLKTIETLRKLFRVASGSGSSTKPIPLKRILFVDDRAKKHDLEKQEAGGLTYLKPSHYRPAAAEVPLILRQQLFAIAIEAMDRAGLLQDKEYQESGFCHRDMPHSWTKLHPVRSCLDLLQWVWGEIADVKLPQRSWPRDTAALRAASIKFFSSGGGANPPLEDV